ncbi:MAG: ABC transporter ATP-binding protein [Candidatus Dormibacteria bacterium]
MRLLSFLDRRPANGHRPAAETRPMGTGVLLAVEGLAAGYGGIEVIRDVYLHVKWGEVVACIGANGAGKTTTLRAISGVIRPSRGRVTFDGQDLTGRSAQSIVGHGLMHVPQGRGLFPKLTVEETLKLSAYSGYTGVGLDPAYDAFPKLKQRRTQLVGTLSGGEQQMVAMARALLVKPKLLMVDEMSQGLAPTVVQQLFRSLEAFKEQGIAVFLVEQFVESALSVADRAYVFEQGSVAHEAPAAELLGDQSVIAGAYLGKAGDTREAAADGIGAGPSSQFMEEMMLRIPAELKRGLEERAAREGRLPEAIVLELLGGEEEEKS